MTLLPPPAYVIFSAFVPRGLFLPAALPKTSDQLPSYSHRTPLHVQAAAVPACEPRLLVRVPASQNCSLSTGRNLGVLVTKPGLGPLRPSLLSSGSADVTVSPECCPYSRIHTGSSTSTLKGPSHHEIGSRISAREKLTYIVH